MKLNFPQFYDRRDAGRQLGARLKHYADQPNVIVLALPRGGVPVAFEVAQALHVPLDVFIVRKLGAPGQEELAFGAIASGGVRVLNQSMLLSLNLPRKEIEAVTAEQTRELERREHLYRDDLPPVDVRGRTVILVDDGVATGSTIYAAVSALKRQQPASLMIAVPTAPPQTCDTFRNIVDEVVCLITPEPFHAVGLWYENFPQITDEEVKDLLKDQVRQ